MKPTRIIVACLCLVAGNLVAAAEPAGKVVQQATPTATPEGIVFFEKKIRPVLVANCYQCHSAQAAQVKGELLLDTRAGVQRGGETGAIIVPGDPDGSPLIHALRYADDAPAMPPRKQLPAEVIADFVQWVKLGAPDPREGKSEVVKSQGIDIEKGRQFWAFVPPKATEPPKVKDAAWPRTTEDRYLLAAMEAQGLKSVGDANPYALVRRLYLDLTGMPPTPVEVEAFARDYEVNQKDHEQAYLALVDRLLASPQFGERWGRHWLDIARFAETSGRQINFNYPQAWRYRDWVIAAFNADKPYDQFVREQIAGDLLPAEDAKQRAQLQIATGFLAIGPKPHSEQQPLQFTMDLVDEQIDATTQAFLGLTVACARCHDHKFDPIPQRDYYALAGIFRSTETCYGTIRIIQSLNPSPLVDLPADAGVPSALATIKPEDVSKLKEQHAALQAKFDDAKKGGKPTTGTEYNNLGTTESKINSYTAEGVPLPKAMGTRDHSKPTDSPLFGRGEIDKPGEVVPRGMIQVVSREAPAVIGLASGRLELANWLTAKNNPLTARVFVNRVWTHLFGRGLVPTPDNFGAAGMSPDHPQLLDHVAIEFVEDGWSIKRLIRRLVSSRAYRQSTHHDAASYERDPDNVYVWRMSPARLEAEVIRDSLLDAAALLDQTPPVGSPVAQDGENGSNRLLRQLAALDAKDLHRAVYLPVIRDNVMESLSLFDFADPSLISSQRAATTVPAQSLFLLNSPTVLSASDAAATRLLNEVKDDGERVRLLYLRLLSRPPSEAEQQAAQRFLSYYASQPQKTLPRLPRSTIKPIEFVSWSALVQALVCSADFLHRP